MTTEEEVAKFVKEAGEFTELKSNVKTRAIQFFTQNHKACMKSIEAEGYQARLEGGLSTKCGHDLVLKVFVHDVANMIAKEECIELEYGDYLLIHDNGRFKYVEKIDNKRYNFFYIS